MEQYAIEYIIFIIAYLVGQKNPTMWKFIGKYKIIFSDYLGIGI